MATVEYPADFRSWDKTARDSLESYAQTMRDCALVASYCDERFAELVIDFSQETEKHWFEIGFRRMFEDDRVY